MKIIKIVAICVVVLIFALAILIIVEVNDYVIPTSVDLRKG